MAGESHEAAEEGLLSFREGDIILVLSDHQEVSVCLNKAHPPSAVCPVHAES